MATKKKITFTDLAIIRETENNAARQPKIVTRCKNDIMAAKKELQRQIKMCQQEIEYCQKQLEKAKTDLPKMRKKLAEVKKRYTKDYVFDFAVFAPMEGSVPKFLMKAYKRAAAALKDKNGATGIAAAAPN